MMESNKLGPQGREGAHRELSVVGELAALLGGLREGLLIVDEQERVRFVNLSATKLLGRTEGQLLDQTVDIAYEINRVKELEIAQKGGEGVSLEVFAKMISWEGQACRLISLRDVTDRSRREQAKNDVVSKVSHELRAPLGVIRETIALAMEEVLGPVNDEQRQFLQGAHAQVCRLGELINNLLDLSKIEAGRLTLRRCQMDLRSLIQETCQTVQVSAGKRNLETVLEAAPSVLADRDRMIQVLINLLSNAIKVTPDGQRIVVKLSAEREAVTLSVTDTGPGIPAGQKDRLFKKFGQIHQANGQAVKGTGLGLAICKELVDLHGGRIGVTSKPGEGATFFVKLPVHSEAESLSQLFNDAVEAARSDEGTMGIILVDLERIAGLLRAEGEGGEEALKDLESKLREGLREDRSLRVGKSQMMIFVVTDERGLAAIRHRMQDLAERWAARHFKAGPAHAVKVGAAMYPKDGQGLNELIGVAGGQTLPQKKAVKQRILLGDDDPSIRLMMRKRLEYEGYDVVEAKTGAEVLERVTAEGPVNLLILDINMPVYDGYEVCRRLRQQPATSELPILIFSGAEDRLQRIAERCMEIGISEWLEKPVKTEELMKRVRRLISGGGENGGA